VRGEDLVVRFVPEGDESSVNVFHCKLVLGKEGERKWKKKGKREK